MTVLIEGIPAEMKAMGLVKDGENIRYFYSDAITDFSESFYFVSDQKLVLVNAEWMEPEVVISLEDLVEVEAHYEDDFFTDSTVFVTTKSGDEYMFPVSNEKGLDKKFVEAVKAKLPPPEEGLGEH